jgi:hypothetical protein
MPVFCEEIHASERLNRSQSAALPRSAAIWNFAFGISRYRRPVIECPYCRTPLTETTTACPSCRLDLTRAKAVMGPAPRLSNRGVTDFVHCLRASEERRLARAVGAFQQRFPQSRLALIFNRFAPEFPLGAHLFWLFNTSGLASQDRKWGKNRDILIGIDTDRGLAGLTVGYGLEPFLGQKALDHVMQLAVPNLEAEDYAAGAHEIVKGLSRLLEGVCRDLRDMLGLDYDFAVEEKAGEY